MSNFKAETIYREYFDQAGNQKKLFPGEELVKRDPEVYVAIKKAEDKTRSKVAVVDKFLEIGKQHSDAVDYCNDLLDRAGPPGSKSEYRWKKQGAVVDKLKAELDKAQQAVVDVIKPTISKLFPDFDFNTKYFNIGHFLTEIDGHAYLILDNQGSSKGWDNCNCIIVRDDGMIMPGLDQIYTTVKDRRAAFKAFYNAAKANG